MQKASKLFYCICFFGGCLTAQAQTTGSNITTLNQAIEIAKSRKANELNLSVQIAKPVQVNPEPLTVKSSQSKTPPKLWSIQGAGNDLWAEVVYEDRIHEVSISKNNVRLGNWLLIELNDSEAKFRTFSKKRKSNPSILSLKLLRPQEANALFQSQLDVANAMRTVDLRPPVPPSLLKP